MDLSGLKVTSQGRGQPLYLAACEVLKKGVDAGVFPVGRRLPSTKELARHMEISLVTAHRALLELVHAGVLRRAQGKGTFVHERYGQRRGSAAMRIGLVSPAEDALEYFYRARVFEGIRQAARQLSIDLLLLGLDEDVRGECSGLVMMSPQPEQIETIVSSNNHKPALIVGARSSSPRAGWMDIDNFDIGRRAAMHLCDAGHQLIGFMGGEDSVIHAQERWRGFLACCQQRNVALRDQNIIRCLTWKLDHREHMGLIRALSSPSRPTAIFAAGYDFAMDVYAAARTVGLSIPRDLSVIGVDDTPSTPNLDPPMTTFRQPLVQLGHTAVTTLHDQVANEDWVPVGRTLRAELIIRGSTGSPG
ncbi:MAG TPA: GntR family transcriptional regulator [Tepidisphaeraceae bacterium]|nr:GntR family transcriptional regulator [Tepidisphaeraceae bacterium]